MKTSATKQLIIDAALELFSVQGFEATSVGQIADAVGIRKSSLYSHFKSKEEILSTLLESLSEEYEKNSPLANSSAERNAAAFSTEAIITQVQGQLLFLLHDAHISKVRKLLTIEQFRNPEIAEMQTKRVYTDILNYNMQTVKALIDGAVLIDGDVEIMAAQLAFPVSAWLSLCDREPEREREVMALVEKHIRQFFEAYGRKN